MQETFLNSYGGVRDTTAGRMLLQEFPLQYKEREGWMNALAHVPSVPHAQAHAIASALPSMGNLIQACLDPVRFGPLNGCHWLTGVSHQIMHDNLA